MVPKGGLDRVSLGGPRHRHLRRGFGLTLSPRSRFYFLSGRRPKPVRVPAEHHETKKERWISPPLPGRFMVPKGGLEPPRVSPPPLLLKKGRSRWPRPSGSLSKQSAVSVFLLFI